jgi:hypothetical protein
MNWLDTETKALLQKDDDPKLSPAKVPEFAIVLGDKGADRQRLVRAIRRINDCSISRAEDFAKAYCPVTINSDLTEGEAALGQFEFICCDAISAVVRSEVAERGDKEYLKELLQKVAASYEFKPVKIQIDEVPLNEGGRKFVDQFLGLELQKLRDVGFPRVYLMARKKARIMKHWARKVGAQVRDVTL